MTLIGSLPNQVPVNGLLGTMAFQDGGAVDITGGRAAVQLHRTPIAKSDSFAVGPGESMFIVTGSATVTVTLPDAATNVGREIWMVTRAAFTVVSASSNVASRTSGALSTSILAATTGRWALLVSDGTVWQLMAGN